MSKGYVRLGTNLEVNTGGGSFGIVDSLGASLDIWAHTVVVAGSESRSITQAMNGNSVVGSAEADSTGVAGKATLSNVVRRFATNEESVTTEDCVGSERWSLNSNFRSFQGHVRRIQVTNLEDIKESAGVETRLLVNGSQQGRLGAFLRQQSSSEVELQTLGNLVLELNLGAKHVRGRPGLGESETVVLEVVLGLDVAGDSSLGISDESSLEGHAGRRGGLHIESGAVNGEVLAEEVIGGLSKVLES